MGGTCKGVGGWEGDGWDGGGGGWAPGGGLNLPLGLFGLAMSPRSASHRPNMLRRAKRRLTTTGVNFRPMPSIKCPPWVPLSQS